MVDELFEMDGDDRVVLRLHVQPGAGRSELVGRHGDAVKVRVAAPPEGGRANDACRRLLAEVFEIKESAVVIVAGETSRTKRVALMGAEPAAVRARLDRVLGAGSARTSSDRHGPAPHSPRP
ncbi:MAG TPA: DUF167 domain-containing protein [Acidimicrobiales bacterium]|nr:DUF167 domain-containing protein [Acidimicrobiales bacterium]